MNIKEKTVETFKELGNNLQRKGIAEEFVTKRVFPNNGGIYVAENVHAFYRVIPNSGKTIYNAIYITGNAKLSTENELDFSARIIDWNWRYEVQDNIAGLSKDVANREEEIEKIMKQLRGKEINPHIIENGKSLYDAIRLEEIIFRKIPLWQLR